MKNLLNRLNFTCNEDNIRKIAPAYLGIALMLTIIAGQAQDHNTQKSAMERITTAAPKPDSILNTHNTTAGKSKQNREQLNFIKQQFGLKVR